MERRLFVFTPTEAIGLQKGLKTLRKSKRLRTRDRKVADLCLIAIIKAISNSDEKVMIEEKTMINILRIFTKVEPWIIKLANPYLKSKGLDND